MPLAAAQLREWLEVPTDELGSRARIPFTLTETREELYRLFADELFDDLAAARRHGRRISVIVPLGPTGQYPMLAQRINDERLSLEHVTFFGMDEWLDWQGRPIPLEHPFSLEGSFRRNFLALLNDELRPSDDAVIFPSPLALDRPAEEMERRGAVAGTYGGVGFQGHIA